MPDKQTPGISNVPKGDWPKAIEDGANLGDYLAPGSPAHKRVLAYLLSRLRLSERKMSEFYPRWNYQEKRIQGYIKRDTYEAMLKAQNDDGEAPSVVSVSIPYSYATVATIVTYLTQVFVGRRPIFNVKGGKGNSTGAAAGMEIILQYQADHEFIIKTIIQSLFDGQVYGMSAIKVLWKDERAMRTVWKAPAADVLAQIDPNAPQPSAAKVRTREEHTVYSGNNISGIDPFLFFPDPRVRSPSVLPVVSSCSGGTSVEFMS